jgi:hypothetical protein
MNQTKFATFLAAAAFASSAIICNHFVHPTMTAKAAVDCWTSQAGCHGKVDITIPATDKTSWSYTMFHGNTGGRENFVLRPGDRHTVNVQSGDWYCVVAGSSGVPNPPPNHNWFHVVEP